MYSYLKKIFADYKYDIPYLLNKYDKKMMVSLSSYNVLIYIFFRDKK